MNHYGNAEDEDEADTREQDAGPTSDARNQMFAHIRNMNRYGNAEDGGEADTANYGPRSTVTPSAHYQEAAVVC